MLSINHPKAPAINSDLAEWFAPRRAATIWPGTGLFG